MNNLNKSALVGLIFVGIGALLILDNLRIIPWQLTHYILQWENILIVLGVVLIISGENRTPGYILLGLGVLFSLNEWVNFDINIGDLWPLVFIIIGASIISKTRKSDHSQKFDSNIKDEDIIEDTAVFGGGDKIITSGNFKGGSLTAICGGSNIDLTQSKLSEGKNEIDVFYLFGGSKIRVPQDWTIHLQTTGIFGGMSEKRKFVDSSIDQSKELYIKGIAIFGGSEITN
jgi:predicted membrane protein